MRDDGMKEYSPVRIKRVRMMLKLNQQQFAVLCGVMTPTVSRWENGRSSTHPNQLEKIKKLEKQVYQSVTGEDLKNQQSIDIDV